LLRLLSQTITSSSSLNQSGSLQPIAPRLGATQLVHFNCIKFRMVHVRGDMATARTVMVLTRSFVLSAFCFATTVYAQQPLGSQPAPSASSSPAGAASSGQSTSSNDGSLEGTVLDQTGAVAVGAKVRLTRPDDKGVQEASSGDDGQFAFSNLDPGPFQLSVSAPGFRTSTFNGELQAGQVFLVPTIVLNVTPASTTVSVGLTTEQVAQVQIKQQEKQRVLGIVPNFYVSYIPDAAPMTSRQKFQLAWKSVSDPINIMGVGMLAGAQQAANDYGGLGQEAGGYAKRFSVAYASFITGSFIDDAVLASLMKQDPRYFYQGTGSTRSRLLHAVEHAVMRKGDNGNWQFSYSGVLGSFASAGITSFYYPESDRSAGLVVQNALVGIAGRAVGGVFQEFVLRKFTSHSSAANQP
jgi:Carboxypeptidase regulatory-like domain